MEFKEIHKNILVVTVFALCLLTTIGLFIFGAVTPPPGEIHNSILSAGGILLGFAVTGMIPSFIKSAKSLSIKHGDTEISAELKEKKQE